MIKQFHLLMLGAALILTSCKKDNKTPACIDTKVNEFKNIISCNTGSKVKQFEFQSKLVYVFDPGTCGADMTSEVLDENCNSLGFLGGIMGNTKINGADFSQAKYKSTLWSR
jgi:hypothetical protein